jgi:hypothetical protein
MLLSYSKSNLATDLTTKGRIFSPNHAEIFFEVGVGKFWKGGGMARGEGGEVRGGGAEETAEKASTGGGKLKLRTARKPHGILM